jgi:hypothetical protein
MAVTRSGSTLRTFLNGALITSASDSSNLNGTNGIQFGRYPPGGDLFTGYLSNVRLTKGGALYTASFTPPTAPLTTTVSSGTVGFLGFQSNRFVDNSGNNITLTPTGTPSVEAFSPFNPTAAYSAATNGGSGYFDGSGDYLTTAAGVNLGSSDFTIEYWVYTNTSGDFTPLCQWGGSTSNWILQYQSGRFIFYYRENGTTSPDYSVAGSSTVKPYAWTHVAVSRTGSTLSIFVNGTREGTTSITRTIGNNRGFDVGRNGDNLQYCNGYVSGARVVAGSYVYDATQSTLTVPTSPPTAVTNTGLLLNFTNAGIIDNSAKNDLVTVGNAQISTAQSKFGGASMYFDGTGDYLQNRLTDLTNFGTGDFTMECWIYPTASGSLRAIVDTRGTDINAAYGWFLSASDKLDFLYKGSSPFRLTSSGSVSTNTWTHVAVCRASGTLRLFINGNIDGSATVTDSLNGAAGTRIGGGYADGSGNPGFYLTGYIDDLRITKGIARYTSNFTPQTSQWQDQ